MLICIFHSLLYPYRGTHMSMIIHKNAANYLQSIIIIIIIIIINNYGLA